jgi:pyrroline-5-carboxylate reductase
MSHHKVVIIGGGRLGSAVAKGLVKNGYPIEKITVTQRNLEKRKLLEREVFRVVPALSNYVNFDMIIIAVKAQDLDEVLRDIVAHNKERTSVISAVSEVKSETLLAILNNQLPLFRAKFSIFVDVNQEIIPLSLCNPRANQEVSNVNGFLRFLGAPCVVPEAIMQMSGWELTSLPGIIFAQMIKQRLNHAGSENAQLTEKFILSGLRSLLFYLESESQRGKSLSETIDNLRDRIATPGGANEKLVAFLQENDFLSLLSHARKVYQDRIESPDITH